MPELPLDWHDPRLALLAALVSGHLLGDFFFQTRWMVEHKGRSLRALLAHALELGLVQLVCVLWLDPSWRAPLLCAAIALVHAAVDRAKAALGRRWPERALSWLVLDQLAHLATLLLAWRAWLTLEPAFSTRLLPEPAQVLLVAGVYAFNVNGGAAFVSALIARVRVEGAPDEPAASDGAGRLIGILERLMIVTLVWLGQWGAVGLVLTAKSIARFKRLEEQTFAETYLVGTITSVMVAMASGIALRALV